ncbi:hypothetical protein QAD02_020218 [Eretmocerus hayati]|uniref:Uncharacterized protein n=1 Tax=Eretmocerus hayati TaxID=131215 RepID=A0ACC2PLS1_9HYME|nr:hypothetical protein QAD02_020218 [Eretmocerus hayati]
MDEILSEGVGIGRDDLVPVPDESLISLERLDRDSPDLWPEQNITKFVSQGSPPPEVPVWSLTITNEDINEIYELGHLPIDELISEVKKLHDLAYQLGVEESKEMTRGKFLNIFRHL